MTPSPRNALRWLRQPLGPPPRGGDALVWAVVWLIAGIFLWFALPWPPKPWFSGVAGAALLAMRLWRRREHVAWARALARWLWPLAMVLLGLALAGWRIEAQHTPLLPANVGGTQLVGVVEQVRPHRPDQARMVLRVRKISRVKPAFWPRRVRLTITGLKAGRGDAPKGRHGRDWTTLPLPGDVVRLKARLLRLPQPLEPGAYDPARDLYMAGIGATGFASAKGIRLLRGSCTGCGLALRLERGLERLRRAVARAIATRMRNPDAAALAQALTIGARGLLPHALRENLRAAGLAHILAISGLHLALLAGAVFWLLRAILALFPALALRWPLKKAAALGAWLVALAYLLVSGNSVATGRAFVMLSVALLALLADRPAISMRNLAIAALFILLAWPHKALSAGFQMSFMAVMGLVAAYEAIGWWRARRRQRREEAGPPVQHGPLARAGRWLALALGGLLLSTLVASAFTALPAAWHFNRLPVHGLLGNLAALPLLSVLVMPAALLTLALLPLSALLHGLGVAGWADALLRPPLLLMEQGLAAILRATRAIAALPGGFWHIPVLSASATVLLAAGLLWLALRNDRARLLGLLPVALLLTGAWPAFAPRPDVLVEERARLAAVRMADGRLAATPGRAGNFALRIWLRGDGDAATPKQARRRPGWRCDALMCRARLPAGARVLYLKDVFRQRRKPRIEEREKALEAMQQACEQAEIVIAAFPLRGLCGRRGEKPGQRQQQERGKERGEGQGKARAQGHDQGHEQGQGWERIIIDRFDVWRDGAHALFLRAGAGPRLRPRTARGERARLPWAQAPLPRYRVLRRRRTAGG